MIRPPVRRSADADRGAGAARRGAAGLDAGGSGHAPGRVGGRVARLPQPAGAIDEDRRPLPDDRDPRGRRSRGGSRRSRRRALGAGAVEIRRRRRRGRGRCASNCSSPRLETAVTLARRRAGGCNRRIDRQVDLGIAPREGHRFRRHGDPRRRTSGCPAPASPDAFLPGRGHRRRGCGRSRARGEVVDRR